MAMQGGSNEQAGSCGHRRAGTNPAWQFQGELKDLSAADLGAAAIVDALKRAGLAPDAVDEVMFGCVLTAGQGQAPARQAALGAGLPPGVGATTVNKMCGSGMKAAMLAHDLIKAESASIVVAGGMESMTNAPYLLDRARQGYRIGHQKVLDHMFLDGLEDAYDKGRLMGTFAEDCAEAYQFTRSAQDEYAIASLEKAQKASADGSFAEEIVPLSIASGKGTDRQPGRAAAEGAARQDSSVETGFSRRRHDHGRERLFDFRRGSGAGADAPVGGG